MTRFSKILKVAVAVVAVVGVGVFFGWLGTRGSQNASKMQQAQQTETPDNTLPSRQVPQDVTPRVLNPHARMMPSNPPPVEASTTPEPADANLITNWEDKLEAILTAEGDDADKAKQLLAMFPHLPEDGQVEVAQHLSNLTSDKDYAPLGSYLTNSSTSEEVKDVLMADVLNRPNSLKLPLLLDVARDPQNPKASEAKDILELFLEEDYGTDWPTWQSKMQQWLADNPD